MGTIIELEKSIKENQEIIGGVLLGMHQDIQGQQRAVDEKIGNWVDTFNKIELKLAEQVIILNTQNSDFYDKALESLSNANDTIQTMKDNSEKLVSSVLDSIENLKKLSSDNWSMINRQILQLFSNINSNIDDMERNIEAKFDKLSNHFQKKNDELINEIGRLSHQQNQVIVQKMTIIEESMTVSSEALILKLTEITKKNQLLIWMNVLTIATTVGLLFILLR